MSEAHCNNLPQRKAMGLVTHDNTGGPFVVECQGCGSVYPSFQCLGGGQIADTGDYDDARCPHCEQVDPEECENVGLVWNTQQLRINELQQRLNAADQRIDELTSPFQSRVHPWLMECFGPMIAGDREERNHRFLEEALELVQACGCSATESHKLVDYVYGRDIGEPAQEVGGVMVTLAALCLANDIDMHAAGETELARIWTKVEQIRAKQAAKPQMSPLPGAYPQRTPL